MAYAFRVGMHALTSVLIASIMFWALVVPQLQKGVSAAVQQTLGASGLTKPHVWPLVKGLVGNSRAQVDLNQSPALLANRNLLLANLGLVVFVAAAVVYAAKSERLSARYVWTHVMWIVVTYALVGLGEVYFATQVAFKYRGVPPSVPLQLALTHVRQVCLA